MKDAQARPERRSATISGETTPGYPNCQRPVNGSPFENQSLKLTEFAYKRTPLILIIDSRRNLSFMNSEVLIFSADIFMRILSEAQSSICFRSRLRLYQQ